MIDPATHWICAHQSRIEWFEKIGNFFNLGHSMIKPRVVVIPIEDDRHSVVDL
jgi:hypothetical protein